MYFLCRKAVPAAKSSEQKKMDPWDEANLLQNMKNEGVHVTTVANQRYVYRGFHQRSNPNYQILIDPQSWVNRP